MDKDKMEWRISVGIAEMKASVIHYRTLRERMKDDDPRLSYIEGKLSGLREGFDCIEAIKRK